MKPFRIVIFLSIAAILASCGSKKRITAEDYIKDEFAVEAQKKKELADEGQKQSSKDKPKGRAAKVVKEAYTWVGTPYRYGGKSKDGADCSGFVLGVFQNALDVKLPRSSHEQSEACRKVSKNKLKPGDFVFFKINKKKISHVGLYVGDGKFIHASGSRGVMVSNLDEEYFVRHFHHGGRHPCLE